MVLLDVHQQNRVDPCLSVGIMDGLTLSSSLTAPSIVSLLKKWPLPTGWKCGVQSDSSWGGGAVKTDGTPTGVVPVGQARADPSLWPPHGSALAPAQGRGDSGQCQTLLHAMAGHGPLHTDCDTWTSVGISPQLHEIMS